MELQYDIFVKKVKANLKNQKIKIEKINEIAQELELSEEDKNIFVYYLFNKMPENKENETFIFSNEIEYEMEKDSSLKYCKDNCKHKPLSREEEIYYAKLKNEGNADAFEILLMSNMRYVIKIAKTYSIKYNIDVQDLAQDGAIGLMRAIEKYDYNYGRLLSYGSDFIRVSIERSIINKYKSVRLPVAIDQICSKLNYIYYNINEKYGRQPTVEEIAEILKISKKNAEYFVKLYFINNVLHLDSPIGSVDDDKITLGDKLSQYLSDDGNVSTIDFKLSMAEDVKRELCGDIFDKYSNQEIENIFEFCRILEKKKNLLIKENSENIKDILEKDELLNELRLQLPEYKKTVSATRTLYFVEYKNLRKYDIFVKTFGLFGNEKMTEQAVGDYYGVTRQRIDDIRQQTTDALKKMILTKYPEYKRRV